MIGWIIAGLLAAAVTVIVIEGIIDKPTLMEKKAELGIEDAIIERVDQCENCVSLKEIKTGNRYECKGTGISNEIKVGSYI